MNLLRYAIAIALSAHGIGHVMGYLASLTSLPMGFSKDPWILPGEFSIGSAVGRAFGLLWLVAMIGFAGAGLGAVGVGFGQERWRSLAQGLGLWALASGRRGGVRWRLLPL